MAPYLQQHPKVHAPKTGLHFIEPFPVTRIINPSAVRLQLPASMQVHPTFHVTQIKPVSECALNPPTNLLPPARLIDNHPAFTVRCILDIRRRGQGYLVDWEGYGPEERSWIPRSFILDPSLITFFKDHPKKRFRSPGGDL